MKIGGVYILTKRSIMRMIVAISAAFTLLCTSAATPNDLLMATRCANAAQSLLSLRLSLENPVSRTVVPEPLYRESKALYLKARRPRGAIPQLPHQTKSQRDIRFTRADRKMLRQIHRASVFGQTPTVSQVAGDVRRQQVLYGLKLYSPASKFVKGVSSYVAAKKAILTPQFYDVEGAYKMSQIKTLARAILREYKSPKDNSAT